MIDSIIFDIGNVLARFCWEDSFHKILNNDEFDKIAKVSVLDEKAWILLDKGVQDFDKLIDVYSKTIPELKEKMTSAILQTYADIKPFDYSYNWVKSYKDRGFKCYILSNYGKIPYELSIPRFDFRNLMDGELVSYQVKLTKPDKEIFKTLCTKYNLTPENSIFIDDNTNNINAANEFGINAVLFTEYKKAVDEIEDIISK